MCLQSTLKLNEQNVEMSIRLCPYDNLSFEAGLTCMKLLQLAWQDGNGLAQPCLDFDMIGKAKSFVMKLWNL